MARFQSGSEIREVVLEGDSDEARLHYCDAQRELLHAGWVRVRDPARELEFRDDDPRDPELERALRENPDDDQTWLVYADHYIQHGHPRGPLIAIESAPVKNIVHRAEREAESRKVRHASPDLIGSLAKRRGWSYKWKRGFVHYARIYDGFARGEAEDLLFDILRHPSMRFLRELELDGWHYDSQDHRLLVDLVLHHVPPPPLRMLRIEYPSDEWSGSPPLGDLGSLGSVYPLLEDVYLECDDTTRVAGLALPRAKRFSFITANMLRHTIAAIATAPWHELEELTLRFGSASPCTIADVRFIFALPKLRGLCLEAAAFTNGIVEELVCSPLAKQLEHLDLRYGALDDRGAQILAQSRSLLHPDLALFVQRTQLSQAGWTSLENAGFRFERRWRY